MDEEAKNRVRNEILDLAAGQATLVGKGAKEFAVLATEQIDDADTAIKSGDPDGVATQHVQLAKCLRDTGIGRIQSGAPLRAATQLRSQSVGIQPNARLMSGARGALVSSINQGVSGLTMIECAERARQCMCDVNRSKAESIPTRDTCRALLQGPAS